MTMTLTTFLLIAITLINLYILAVILSKKTTDKPVKSGVPFRIDTLSNKLKVNIMLKTYSDEERNDLCQAVFERVANGESVRKILKDSQMPCFATFLKWISCDEETVKQYERAMEIRAEYHFDEMFEIADDAAGDYEERVTKDGDLISVFKPENVQRSRLRIDTRKWALSKMNAKKYGDKIEVDNKGDLNLAVKNIVFE
jgi:hypothetical protein